MTTIVVDRQAAEERMKLAAITRQYETLVFTYLYRRLRRSVDAGGMTQETFYRFYAADGLELPRSAVRPKLLEIARGQLEEYLGDDPPSEQKAWTELCLELDDLVQQRNATP